jgi:mannose-6-phosphate isomerase-like protein (cupin superfamily)
MNQHSEAGKQYFEFLRVPSLNAGIYVLAADSNDPQQPHAEDEMYYIISGRATFACDECEPVPVASGSILYVEAGRGHRFTDIEEDLTVLVVFAG